MNEESTGRLAIGARCYPGNRIRIWCSPGYLDADWQYDPTLKTEIEVRFVAEGKNSTRVELEHRHLDRYGARRAEMRRIFDTGGDWGKVLQLFARAVVG